MRRRLALVTALAALLAPSAAAEDAAPSAARRAAEARAAFPAPAPATGFRFETSVSVEGEARPRGTATFAARPAEGADPSHWEITETAEIHDGAPDAPPRRHTTEVVLERDLRLRTYERRVTREGALLERTSVRWGDGDRLTVERSGPGEAARGGSPESARTDRSATATLSGLILFLRQCPAGAAEYELPIFVQEAGAVRTVRVAVTAPSPSAEGTPSGGVVTASAVMGEWTLTIELAAKDRMPRRIVQAKGATRVAFVSTDAPPAGPLDASKPAATAREAGVRFLVGVLAGDEALVTAAFHWPTLLEAERARSGFQGDEAALRREVLAKLRPAFQSVPRAEAERRARAAADSASEADDGTTRRVDFGGPEPRLSYRAKSVDGAWYVVELRAAR